MKFIQVVLLILTALPVFSQDPPLKWKEIALEDLQMQTYDPDPEAPAVILYDYGIRYFDINPNGKILFLFNDRHVRIKILKPEGIKYARVKIPFKDMNCENFPGENSIIIKGMTYNLDKHGKVVAVKLKQNSIKFTDSTECNRYADFTLPDVKVGSVIEYKISIPMLDLVYPQKWYFQSEIPTLCSEFRMRVPTAFNYIFSPRNFENFDVQEESFYAHNINVHLPNQYYRMTPRLFNMSGKQIRLVKYNVERAVPENYSYDIKDKLYALNIHLLKAVRENFEPGYEYLTYALAITTKDDYEEYDPHQRKMIPYPAAYIYYNMPSWDKFNEKMLSSDRFGLALIKHWNHESILQEIINGKESDEQKLFAIYDFIRENMKWNGQYKLFVTPVFNNSLSKLFTKITKKLSNEKSLRKPFEEKEGTSSEINFILIYLLNKAGLKTDPVITSTLGNGTIDTLIRDARQFNHTLALTRLGEKFILLDATDSLRPIGYIGEDKLNRPGFIIRNVNPGWIKLSDAFLTKSSIVEKVEIDENLNASRFFTISQSGYFAQANRKEIATKGKNDFVQEFAKKVLKPGHFANYEIRNLANDSLPLDLNFMVQESNVGKTEIEIVPSVYTLFSASNFAETFRKYPLEFGFPFRWNYLLEVQYPEDFSIEYPENLDYAAAGENAVFHYKVISSGNKIQVSLKFDLKDSEFPNYTYDELASLFSVMEEKLNEKILIKRT